MLAHKLATRFKLDERLTPELSEAGDGRWIRNYRCALALSGPAGL